MEPVSTIATTVISLTLTISQIVTEVQQNREDCLELGEKVERLLPLITPLETATKEDLEKLSSIKTLEKLAKILTSTEEFLSRFVESKKNNGMLSKLWRLGSEALDKNEINETFRNLDKKLDSILIEFTALQTTTRSRTSANLRTERFAAIEDTFCEDPPIADYHDHRSILGRGAYGTTHRMINTTDGRRYAVKRLLLSEAKKKGVSTDMLMNECLLLEKLTHPHISRYFLNFYSKNNMYFNIVMELIQGGTLEDKIPGRPPPTELEIVTWAKQMASALSYMHGEGVMHRDLKPDNVMLSESSKVKIIDLGLASVITSAEMHSMAGTDLYSSYEKLTPGVPYDNRDDIWAMGCILLELLLQTR